MDEKTIKAAISILKNGDRVELIPVKDGVKVVRVRREEVRNARGGPPKEVDTQGDYIVQ